MGDRVAMTAKVDEDVKEQFTEFVIDTKGQKYGEMGRMLERAMQEYMDNDRLARVEAQLDEIQGQLSEEKGERKNTHAGGSVREREDAIINDLLTEETKQVHRRDIEKVIEQHDLTADKTIKKYLQNITDRPVFSPSRSPSVWTVNHEHAEDYY